MADKAYFQPAGNIALPAASIAALDVFGVPHATEAGSRLNDGERWFRGESNDGEDEAWRAIAGRPSLR